MATAESKEETIARVSEIVKTKGPIVPDRDIKPLVAILNEAIDKENMRMALPEDLPPEADALPPAEEEIPGAAPEEGAMPEDETDMSPLVEMLGIDEAKALELFEAAKQLPELADLTPQQLADVLVEDFQMRMRLEELAAGASDVAAEEAMDDMGMMAPPMAPPGPPMGNPEEMPPGGGY
jgi:hypothetical protein